MMKVFSPAKLNLFLHILGRLPNGYHALQSVFVPIRWGDQIELIKREDGQVRRVTDLGFDAEKDLMVRAAHILKEQCRVAAGVDIYINKVLPMGGGLGGGSSNAASVLLALCDLWNVKLSAKALSEMALSLGADVPFFLQQSAAIVEGIGESVTPIDLPEWQYLVLVPNIQVPTQLLFQQESLQRNDQVRSHASITEAMNTARSDDGHVALWGINRMQKVAFELFPELQELYDLAYMQGIKLRMTGSGACLFAVFDDAYQAHIALDKLMLMKDSAQSHGLIKEVVLVPQN